jgi:hypothetical protein
VPLPKGAEVLGSGEGDGERCMSKKPGFSNN